MATVLERIVGAVASLYYYTGFFFFQAEDGIRDLTVTGVQTCALPIWFLIDALNVSRYFLPHLLCLSTSSPFWMGRSTGLKSYRSVVFRGFPRTGVPRALRSWSEYTELVEVLSRTQCIPDGSKIWWDVRPNWSYPTLEFRVCDVCTRVDEAVCVAAIIQAVVAKLWRLRRDNLSFRVYPAEFIEENKWRAVRYGLDGQLIDFGKGIELPARELVRELLEWFIEIGRAHV